MTDYRKTSSTLFIFLLSITICLHANSPVWTFTPLTFTSISVPNNSTAIVQYLVTNQSTKGHRLTMKPIPGITQITTGGGICTNSFTLKSKGSSCVLSLEIHGDQLTHPIADGPIVCQQSSLQCYRPNPLDVLNINVEPS